MIHVVAVAGLARASGRAVVGDYAKSLAGEMAHLGTQSFGAELASP